MNGRLLSIDVQAALAKVSVGRLRSNAQVPLALARAAAAAHPKLLRIDLRRNRIALEHDGMPWRPGIFDLLELLLDRNADDLDRHRALEYLESLSLLDLLVALSVDAREVILQSAAPVCLTLRYRPRGTLSVRRCRPASVSKLVVAGWAGNPAQQSEELIEHLRYAHFQVWLNGRRIDRGIHLEDALLVRHFGLADIDGLVGLPRHGLAARTRVVVNGVLVQQVWDSPPSGAVWDALVRCPPEAQAKAKAMVSQQLAGLYRQVSETFPSLSASDRDRVAQLLFRLADHGAGASAVAGVPMFRRVKGELATAAELRQAALGRVLRAIGPGAPSARYEHSGEVFVLDERERSFAERHLDLLVREPRRKPSPQSKIRAFLDSWLERTRKTVRQLLRKLTAAQVVAEQRLTIPEARFRLALQKTLDTGLLPKHTGARVDFIRGGLAGWRWLNTVDGPERLLLGRSHSQVQAMVRAFADRPEKLYPTLMLLADGQDAFGLQRDEAAARLAGLTLEDTGHTFHK